MRESKIEAYLVKRVKKLGGRAYKWVSPGSAGVPDRIVIMGGQVYFVELKAPGKTLSVNQRAQRANLRALGMDVSVLTSKIEIDYFLARTKK